jgi:NTP pyrophosphatase (non-canonical NTP hydrolase)
MKVSEMVEMTREITALFDKVVPRPWGIEAMVTELVGEVGTLADEVMIKEGYRPLREGDNLNLEDDLVDIIFMLIRIADYYSIDLERAYTRMIDETRRKLEKRIHEGGEQ